MNRYDFYPGDYLKGTLATTMLQDGAYRRLMDHYYSTEQPIEDEDKFRIARAFTNEEQAATQWVLDRFFERDGSVWRHEVIERNIEKAMPKIATARANGRKGGRPKKQLEEPSGFSSANPERTQSEPNQNPERKLPSPSPSPSPSPIDDDGEKPTGFNSANQGLVPEQPTSASSAVLGSVTRDDVEVLCPKSPLPDQVVESLAESYNTTPVAIRAAISEFVGYWSIGGGTGRTRTKVGWMRSCREDLRRKADQGKLAPAQEQDDVTDADIAARQAMWDEADRLERETKLQAARLRKAESGQPPNLKALIGGIG